MLLCVLVSDISEMDHDGEVAPEVAMTASEKLKSYKIPKKGVMASQVVAKQVKTKKLSKKVEHDKDDNLDLEQDIDDQLDLHHIETFSDEAEAVNVAEEPKKTQNDGATPNVVESNDDDEAMPEVPLLAAKQKSDRENLDMEKKMSKIFGTSSEEDSADSNVEKTKPSTSTSIKKRLRQNPSPSKRYICESKFNPVIDLDRAEHIPIVRLDRLKVKSHVSKGSLISESCSLKNKGAKSRP